MPVIEGVYTGAVGLELVFDLGTYDVFGVRTGFDLTLSNARDILYTKPSGATGTWSAAIKGDPTQGYLSYVTQANDLNEVGAWALQPRINLAGSIFFARTDTMQVNQALT